MDLLIEKSLAKALQTILGKDVWNSLSRVRRAALLELVEQYGMQLMPMSLGSRHRPDEEQIQQFAKARIKEIEAKEFLAVLKNDMSEFPDSGTQDYVLTKKVFERLYNRMTEIINKLKELKFDHPDMEKRRVQIVDAAEKRISIPSDHYDLWVLNHAVSVVPMLISEEEFKKIDDWVKETTPK